MFNSRRISALARRGGAIICVAAAVVALAAVFKAEAGEPGAWAVVSAEGVVTIDSKAVDSSGATIDQGSVIETGADGNVVLSRPGDSITLFPNSRMSVPVLAGGEDPGVLQTLGKLLFRMESRESRDFKIETPYLAAAIKGTTFTVEVGDDNAVVEVSEGSVLVTANRSGQSAYVGPGESAGVAGDGGDAVQVSKVDDDAGLSEGKTTSMEDSVEKSLEGELAGSTGSNTGSSSGGSPGGKDSPDDHDKGKGNDPK